MSRSPASVFIWSAIITAVFATVFTFLFLINETTNVKAQVTRLEKKLEATQTASQQSAEKVLGFEDQATIKHINQNFDAQRARTDEVIKALNNLQQQVNSIIATLNNRQSSAPTNPQN